MGSISNIPEPTPSEPPKKGGGGGSQSPEIQKATVIAKFKLIAEKIGTATDKRGKQPQKASVAKAITIKIKTRDGQEYSGVIKHLDLDANTVMVDDHTIDIAQIDSVEIT